MMDDELFKNLVGKIVDKGKQNDILHPDVPDKEKMIEALSGLISYASSIDRTKGAEKDLFGRNISLSGDLLMKRCTVISHLSNMILWNIAETSCIYFSMMK